MFRRLLKLLFGPIEPPPLSQSPPRPTLQDDRWIRSWLEVSQALRRYDADRSGPFVYEAMALQVLLRALPVKQVEELLDSSLAVHRERVRLGRASDLDCRRVWSLSFELRRRRRLPRVFRPAGRPSSN